MNAIVLCLSCLIMSAQDPISEELFGQEPVPVKIKRDTSLDKYHPAEFYYYNEKREPIGLFLLPKIAFNAGQKFLNEKIVSDAQNITETDEYTILEYDPQIANLEFMFNKLHELESFGVLPVIIYQDKECVVADNRVIFEAKSSVGFKLLKERLAKFGKFKFVLLEAVESEINSSMVPVYEMLVGDLETPSNILTLANLIAEDDVYFKWAMPKFKPLNPPISAVMYVTSPGLPTLGAKRILHVDIEIYDSNVSLVKDLVPQLGEGEFVPNVPQFNDAWFWADKPIVTETTKSFVRIISYEWPFMFLDAGANSPRPIQDKIPIIEFKGIKLVYTQKTADKVVERLYFVEGAPFQIGSVIEKSLVPINDIQPVHDYKAQNVSVKNNLNQINSENKNTFLLVYNWLSQQGLDVAGISILVASMLLYFNLFVPAVIFVATSRRNRRAKEDYHGDWDGLADLRNLLGTTNDWKSIYSLIEHRLKFILNKYFSLDVKISSEDVDENYPVNVKDILWELERIYRGEEEPHYEDICLLKDRINSLINLYQTKGVSHD